VEEKYHPGRKDQGDKNHVEDSFTVAQKVGVVASGSH
jgi:hypothetical protein